MTGYRQHSFDLDAYDQPGPPLKPYNWVQWTGVAIIAVCLVVELVYFAGRFGWIEPLFEKSPRAFLFVIVGITLINSRRAPGTPIDEEQRDRNRHTLIVTAVICTVILGLVALVELEAFG